MSFEKVPSSSTIADLPVVDLSDFLSPDHSKKQKFISTVGDALKYFGFFALKNHQVEQNLITESYREAELLFSLPEKIKSQYEDSKNQGQRGYVSFAKEHAKDSAFPDLKEFWHIGRETKSLSPSLTSVMSNIWPHESQGFRQVMTRLFNQLETCSQFLLQACALYMGENQEFLSKSIKNSDSLLRVIHYPPVDGSFKGSIRAAAHEDINLITLLCESTAAGLELLSHEGEWKSIHQLSGHIIVDSGDMLQNISNGLFKSTTHRVINPAECDQSRYSMPFFCHPHKDFDLTPRSIAIEKTTGTKDFSQITASQYLKQRLDEIGLKSESIN